MSPADVAAALRDPVDVSTQQALTLEEAVAEVQLARAIARAEFKPDTGARPAS